MVILFYLADVSEMFLIGYLCSTSSLLYKVNVSKMEDTRHDRKQILEVEKRYGKAYKNSEK